mgnify:CR=1 FL=1
MNKYLFGLLRSFDLSRYQNKIILGSTVKLGIKELLNKEQIGFKKLFTDYQLFYTINLLLNKELLPIKQMPNLALTLFLPRMG